MTSNDLPSNNLRGVDLSHIEDKDLTPEQKDELARRFKRFFRVLDKSRREQEQRKKTPRKWIPGQDT